MVLLFIAFIGVSLGSFVNALVWRIHEQDNAKYKKQNLSILTGRSMCPECLHSLSSLDLIPVFSWLYLRGRCRYCHKKISFQYPLIEIITAIVFVLFYHFWPNGFNQLNVILFVISLIILTGLIALAVYDVKWFILPTKIIYSLFLLAVGYRIILLISQHNIVSSLMDMFWGLIIGGGFFYLLYIISKGKWIGGGDIRLGFLLGLLIGGPLDSILFLFIASLLGSLFSLPLLVSKKVNSKTMIPFGPFLIIAAIIIQLFGTSIIALARKYYFLPA